MGTMISLALETGTITSDFGVSATVSDPSVEIKAITSPT